VGPIVPYIILEYGLNIGKLLILFMISHLILVSSPSQSAVNSRPLFGAAIVTRFLTGNFV